MPARNTFARYGSVAKWFHWTTAALVLFLIPLGIIADDMSRDTSEQLAQKAFLFQIHKTLGVLVFFIALARILWAIRQEKPAPLHPERVVESFAAETVHWLLYGSLVLVPLTGWIHHAATEGFAPLGGPFSAIFGQDLPFVPKSEYVAHLFSSLHKTFERVLAFSVLLHIAGALKHHVIDHDVTLKRMLPGKACGGTPEKRNTKAPLVAACVVWTFALPVGATMFYLPGLNKNPAPVAAELSEASGNWQVSEGSLALTVTQFANPVTGHFADWSARIIFDENPGLETAGSVEVEVAIASLTLGSVTNQALGPDFFDASDFPVASYKADILPVPDGYKALGTLTLKGREQPVEFEFSLRIEDNTATMQTRFEIMRLDFGIGNNMPDESVLAFPVSVEIELTAHLTTP